MCVYLSLYLCWALLIGGGKGSGYLVSRFGDLRGFRVSFCIRGNMSCIERARQREDLGGWALWQCDTAVPWDDHVSPLANGALPTPPHPTLNHFPSRPFPTLLRSSVAPFIGLTLAPTSRFLFQFNFLLFLLFHPTTQQPNQPH